ncbi:hypothetical protein KDL01_36915, partial [Actinospica durhamensis]
VPFTWFDLSEDPQAIAMARDLNLPSPAPTTVLLDDGRALYDPSRPASPQRATTCGGRPVPSRLFRRAALVPSSPPSSARQATPPAPA